MSTASGLNIASPSIGAAKFAKDAGETVLFKGDLSYSFDGPRIRDFWTRKWDDTNCTAFVTNRRFVATRVRQYYLFGPLVWLIMALIPRKIIFSIPLNELAAIKFDPAQQTKFMLQTTSGMEYTLVSSSLFNYQAEWIAAIATATTQSSPPATAKKSKTAITFSRS